jgi:hypothetical protein
MSQGNVENSDVRPVHCESGDLVDMFPGHIRISPDLCDAF